MAKISLKGICSLSHQLIDKDGKVNIHNIEMNQDDFEDCVMLTVEEAKELALKLKHNAEFFFLQTGEFDYDTDELWQCLTDKIELSEEGNE